jgi:predicted nuclease of predicted toxin-antitoxin system
MRLLADENFPKLLVTNLRDAGHDVAWARTEYPGYKDRVLLDIAEREGRIVLTLDKDFWQLAIQKRPPLRQSGVVLFRVHPATPVTVDPLLQFFTQLDRDWAGHSCIVTPSGVQSLRVPRD